MAACKHSDHRESSIVYRVKSQKNRMALFEGWNQNRHIWEQCDPGLVQGKRIKTRKKPHSQKRKQRNTETELV